MEPAGIRENTDTTQSRLQPKQITAREHRADYSQSRLQLEYTEQITAKADYTYSTQSRLQLEHTEQITARAHRADYSQSRLQLDHTEQITAKYEIPWDKRPNFKLSTNIV